MNISEVTYKIRGAIFKVYNELGPGLLESVYEEALCYQMIEEGLKVERQKEVDILYKDKVLSTKLRLDVLVEDMVIVELKAVESLSNIHFVQIDTYLRLANKSIGFLVNFNTDDIVNDIHRRYNPLAK